MDAAMDIGARMSEAIRMRGPDDDGLWVSQTRQVVLAHRRLSIIDLSPAGHQPMESSTGRYMIVYNGEIYNFREMLHELRRVGAPVDRLRGQSDTEVLLLGFETWGIPETLNRCAGMFAIAVWDRMTSELTLAVDRYGVKPLYWSLSEGRLLFGSTMAALYAVPGFDRRVDPQAVVRLLGRSAAGAPRTIHPHVERLEGGCLLTLSLERPTDVRIRSWWRPETMIPDGGTDLSALDDATLLDMLERHLKVAVERRMVSDVPIGAYLSGGVDSSLIVALMQEASPRPVKTFTIGHKDPQFNEADHARAVAEHLGCEHTELYVGAEELLSVIPQLPDIYDEPFADSSQLPTVLVSRLAREHVTVTLTGDGGDEFFAGYPRYLWLPRLLKRLRMVPVAARRGVHGVLGRVSTAQWRQLWDRFGDALPSELRPALPVNKLEKLIRVMPGRDIEELYERVNLWYETPESLVKDGRSLHRPRRSPKGLSNLRYMMYEDILDFMQNDAMVKVDRASMSCGLEAREPLLDHELSQFAWRMPERMLIRDGIQKWALREVLYRHVPKTLIERPKTGFGVPIGHWLRHDLKPWAAELLSESALGASGVLEVRPIQALWKAHLSGSRDNEYILWNVLMFQAWHQRWGTEGAAS
jgi:asparagine synthase (glutamine-hydrolysing)